MPDYDPDERVSLYPLAGEDVLKKLLGDDDSVEPEDGDDSDD